jgi:hypothetical protein
MAVVAWKLLRENRRHPMAEKRKGWLPPRDGGYKAVRPADKVSSSDPKPVPPKEGSGVSQPTSKNTKE